MIHNHEHDWFWALDYHCWRCEICRKEMPKLNARHTEQIHNGTHIITSAALVRVLKRVVRYTQAGDPKLVDTLKLAEKLIKKESKAND